MNKRTNSLLPGGIPKYVRCYDNGQSADRYTVVFTGNYQRRLWKDGKLTEQRAGYQGRMESFPRPKRYMYLGMSAHPTHPQGVGSHGESERQVDVNKSGFAPAMGRKNHLGKRIPFTELPEDCRKLVLSDYKELWDISGRAKALEQYNKLPVTVTPQEFLNGKGNWGLTEAEYKKAKLLAKQATA